ncbi:hypothetical protein [Ruminococcus sp.]
MNAANGALTKIVDSDTPSNGTGTYQNRLALGNLIGNQNSRYYYNLDVMMSSGHTQTDGEKFLLWSVNKYAAPNLSSHFTGDVTGITDIDLSGLSYYPIPGGSVTIPAYSTVTFGFNAIKTYEGLASTPDSWSRYPDNTGNPKADTARNQHYLMQTGLFTTVTSLTASNLTLTGDFGYVSGAASGALINQSTSGTVSLTGLTLNNLKASSSEAYLLINSIDGTGTATPSLTLSNLRANNYSTGLPVAKSLFGTATGQNMTMNFSNIKLDARNGDEISDTNWTSAAATAMTNAYGTSRSIFSTAIFFTELWAAKSSTMEYYYTVDEDWGTGTPRNVTYGKEVSDSREYNSGDGEKKYNIVGSGTRHYTNPISDSNTAFSFSAGFLPYVGNYTAKGKNSTYPVTEIKVNYKVEGLVEGCGTYNDPYLISTASQLNLIANAVNNGVTPDTIRLPNTMSSESNLPFAATWHTGADSDGLYNISGQGYLKDDTNTSGLTTWTNALVRNYLASAYYVINADLTGANSLPSTFEGIGKPGTNVNGNIVFHGVIVGKKSNGSAPTITNPSGNPLVYISNGSVVKNLKINITGNMTKTQGKVTINGKEENAVGNNALYGYGRTLTNPARYENAVYYGGVIGEIMGGDNIIDDVSVTYTGTTTLDGNYKHLIAEGGMVGCVVNGALIFRGSNTVTGRNASGGGIYSNAYVGRVINGYAIYEQIPGRTGTAPVNGSYYPIDTIDRSNTNKLDVDWDHSTIEVPDAQSLYIMSLITQSIASTADTSSPYNYYKYSPSYGYNTDSGYKYINGVARLGDYTDVGCGSSESASSHGDYNNYAKLDSVNNYTNSSSKDGLMKAPVPYIIYRYTTRYGTTTTNPAADFPARKMTSDNNKFWNITLSQSNTFASMDSFQAFRGIGCVGINSKTATDTTAKTAFKVATFDGNGNTINLHISLPRYERNQENYFHCQNKELTQAYSGEELSSPYGHDQNLVKLMGLGLFDCVMVQKNANHEYQFKDFTLQGIIEDKVYNTSNSDITGKTNNTQLFCVGGVYGKRVNGNGSDVNFQDIKFDGLNISCAYSCGGLVGIDAVKTVQKMKIDGCNSTTNGISVTGGCYGVNTDLRHGVGCFVGMTFWTRPYIDGDDSTTEAVETANISVSNVTVSYDGDSYASVAGGLIGYTGSGAEIKNVKLNGLGSNPVIGSNKVLNAGGFIGFSQADSSNTSIGQIVFDNCTLNGISVQAKNNAAGFLARCGNTNSSYYPRSVNISNCAVIGNSLNKPEIKAYGTNTSDKNRFRFGAGGFVADFSLNSGATNGVIENCYINDYLIEGSNVGGIIGTETIKPAYLKNIYVKDCDIITTLATGDLHGNIGGMVGRSEQNLSGYNLKIDGVNFYRRSGNNLTDVTITDAGIIVGRNSSSLVDKFVAIGAYHTDASKVPTYVVRTNGTNDNNFFVFADYTNTSSALTAATGTPSTFGSANNSDQPYAPFVNVAPHMGIGTDEYLTGDGASVGKAGAIYKDAKANTSNRRYTLGTTNDLSFASTEKTDSAVLAKYINDAGTYIDGVFKISTASAEFGDDFPTGIDNFAMLVINDDSAKANDITPFIKSYIRLVTNADKATVNSNTFTQWAYSCGNNSINDLYRVVISPCYYNGSKFVLGTSGNQGLKMYASDDTTTGNQGKYYFDSANADSASNNTCQFSLIDVQYIDPTDSSKIAYHLYVPVYTKKMLTAEFSVVSMSETKYSRSPYAGKITSELAAGRTVGNPTQLVESTNEWTTTFIRYTYPKNQVPHDANWNYDKSIEITLDNNFQTLPDGTELILVDPNANADKYYTMTLDGTWSTGAPITLNLSSFRDERGNGFTPQSLSSIYADSGATGTKDGKAVLYEDYYISMYVPKADDGYTHSVLFSSGNEMTHHIGNDVYKANIDAKLSSLVVLGDLFEHEIVDNSFSVTSSDGSTDDDAEAMTDTHNILKTDVTATVQIKNKSAGAYLANSNVYHSFFITLTSHDADHKVSDIIYGITGGYISNITTYSYENSSGNHGGIITDNSSLGANFIKLDTGDIISAIYDPTTRPVLTIRSETSMIFNDVTAFPYNVNAAEGIGTQVSIKSSIAYRPEDLRFSALNVFDDDPDGKFYYSTTKNSAELSFNAVPTDDTTDEIGYKTNNRSLLGVNGKYGTSHPIIGRSMYNVDDIVDYESAEYVQYTIELYKKVTDQNGTRYVQVNDISDYLTEVNMTDTKVTLEADRTVPSKYLYTGEIDHDDPLDNEKMFEATFSCNVLTGDSTHNEYANYKIQLTAQLMGASNSWKDAYLIYTNAKIDPSVIDEDS